MHPNSLCPANDFYAVVQGLKEPSMTRLSYRYNMYLNKSVIETKHGDIDTTHP